MSVSVEACVGVKSILWAWRVTAVSVTTSSRHSILIFTFFLIHLYISLILKSRPKDLQRKHLFCSRLGYENKKRLGYGVMVILLGFLIKGKMVLKNMFLINIVDEYNSSQLLNIF